MKNSLANLPDEIVLLFYEYCKSNVISLLCKKFFHNFGFKFCKKLNIKNTHLNKLLYLKTSFYNDLIGYKISKMTTLKYLVIQNLGAISDYSFLRGLKNITILKLYVKKIEDTKNLFDVIGGLQNIEKLCLQFFEFNTQNIDHLVQSLLCLKKLKHLKLKFRNTHIDDLSTFSSLNLESLKNIDLVLYNNKIDDSIFGNLLNINCLKKAKITLNKNIYLNHLPIYDVPEFFNKNYQLTNLDLNMSDQNISDNELDIFSGISHMKSLHKLVLNLQYNRIANINKLSTIFYHNFDLKILNLDVSNNIIENDIIIRYNNIEDLALKLDNNKLNCISLLIYSINNMNFLKCLHLSLLNNYANIISTYSFCNPNISSLTINNNAGEILHDKLYDNIEKMTELKDLHIYNPIYSKTMYFNKIVANNIRQMSISMCNINISRGMNTSIRSLVINNHNKFIKNPQNLNKFINLQNLSLSLSNMNIPDIIFLSIGKLRNLSSLYLHINDNRNIINASRISYLKKLTGLKKLYLSIFNTQIYGNIYNILKHFSFIKNLQFGTDIYKKYIDYKKINLNCQTISLIIPVVNNQIMEIICSNKNIKYLELEPDTIYLKSLMQLCTLENIHSISIYIDDYLLIDTIINIVKHYKYLINFTLKLSDKIMLNNDSLLSFYKLLHIDTLELFTLYIQNRILNSEYIENMKNKFGEHFMFTVM